MRYVIILAGGVGSRCGQEVPKQFALVGGKPVICHTLERFRAIFPLVHINSGKYSVLCRTSRPCLTVT